MKHKTTHIRVEKEILNTQRQMFPEYSANEIFKLGFNTLKGINKMNEFLYGKRWSNEKNK